MKILAVDDNRVTLDLLAVLAGRLGFDDVTTISSSSGALKMIRSGAVTYDCLLLDINMPDLDGIALCGLVRALPAYRQTPIIMLTSMTDRDYVDRAFGAGATDYVTKPFHISELGVRLRSAKVNLTAHSEMLAASSAREELKAVLSKEDLITGLPNFISYKALGNYLSQLSTAALGATQVIALKINDIQMIHERASTQGFLFALREVGEALCVVFPDHSNMMAYAGSGRYVIVQGRKTDVRAAELEMEVKKALDEKNIKFDNGNPMDLNVSIGNPVVARVNSKQPSWDIFDRAIARAESRMIRK
ncbi:response regulator [Sulfitobacter pseudonitzschiae]|uniref:response regulator n=1 Tax=Pseudosulfitobacter pseudonitzschiae TaxID=1402135 RepID=UPI001AF20292|nr:response regulator [Pseudosulfitobacter pseudonitzschiae]MBM1817348.1 response regulator [Pseudosulfitobacter pseudonitzschiae]MBM1834546.1 response regulator [Pseudosulfitobacter pseudonitzschiae]MBM1839411.1 response regulator [Pseudosulfitobacter pseudonitzschiae]MBM1844261.1 response regulator [Pseudosulfitobacter pseudonitzschiae]MBM1849096.1 response regulator [Pseudosulfitobacter pseudonitzschiae]